MFLTGAENLHGTVLEPSIYTVQPTHSAQNFMVIAKIEDRAYWFLPRACKIGGTGRDYIEDDTHLLFPYRLRMHCKNTKPGKTNTGCKAKMNLFLKSIDVSSDDFFNIENFKLGPMEQANEDHFLNCADKDAFKKAFRAYVLIKYKQNKAQIHPLKLADLREKIRKDCEMDEKAAAEIFTKNELHSIANSSYSFEDKLRVNISITIVGKQFSETTLERIYGDSSLPRY
jgi:hypothetical protein